MTNLSLRFEAPPQVVLQQSPALALHFPAPPVAVLRVEGLQGPPGSGGGVTDGDKGGVIVSDGGTVWTVKAGSITDLMLGTSAIALFATAAQGALAGTALQPGATIPWADVTDKPAFASIATSGSASNLNGGTIPAARFTDASHGNRSGGALHADAVAGNASGFMSGADKTKLDGIAPGATVNATDAALRDRATHTGTQLAATISDLAAAVAATPAVAANTAKVTNAIHTGDATGGTVLTLATVNANVGSFGLAGSVARFVVNAKGLITSAVNVAVSIASTAINDSTAAGRAMLTAATAAAQTALLDVFTSGAKGLVPPSGGGTTNFLRADGTFAAPPGGGGSPGGVSGEVQWNNAGAFAGAADVEIEGGQLRLPYVASPAAPAAGGLKLVGAKHAGAMTPGFVGPSGVVRLLQPYAGRGRWGLFMPVNGTLVSTFGMRVAVEGAATGVSFTDNDVRGRVPRIDYRVNTPSTSAVAGWRSEASDLTVGGNIARRGGFEVSMVFGPSTGMSNANRRGFCGMRENDLFSDVSPFSFLNAIGIAYDASTANVQFMHNNGSGVATRIDLGASFPKPSIDDGDTYFVELSSPPGPTQSVSYRVTRLESGAVAEGTVTTDLPATSFGMGPFMYTSVGGTSAVTGLTVGPVQLQTESMA